LFFFSGIFFLFLPLSLPILPRFFVSFPFSPLSNLEKRDKESIREYAQRWRNLAAQVHPPLLDKEMVTLFANMLKDPYYEHVMGSSAQQFTDAVAVAERIEQGMKSGRIFAPTEKRGFEGKKKEVDHVEGMKNPF
jgi:hypothetical protein